MNDNCIKCGTHIDDVEPTKRFLTLGDDGQHVFICFWCCFKRTGEREMKMLENHMLLKSGNVDVKKLFEHIARLEGDIKYLQARLEYLQGKKE